MILDLEKVTSGEQIGGDEDVVFRDVWGEENRIHCHIELSVRRAGESFYIHADLTGVFTTPCHRCLEKTSHELNPAFELVVQRTHPRGRPEPIAAADDFVRLPAGQSRLDLEPYVYENLVVSIPMQLVCSDDCKGLCPTCGANLNRKTCQCGGSVDSRWNKLQELRDTLND